MADNYQFDPGTTSTAAGDDISGVMYPRVKPQLGADGSAIDWPGDATNGGKVQVTVIPALANGSAIIGKVGIDQTIIGVTNAVVANGSIAHDSPDSGSPVKIGVRATNAPLASVSANDRSDLTADLSGRLIVAPYTNPENLVSGATAAITGLQSTQVIAGVASNKLYVTNVLITNSHATVSTLVTLQDGSGGTALYSGYALAAGGGFALTLPDPLVVPTAGNGLFAVCGTNGSNVYVSASGHKSTL